MTTRSIPFIRFGLGAWLLALLLLPLLGWGQIATQNFEATAASPNAPVTTSGGGVLMGNAAYPAGSPQFVSTSRGFGVSGGTATVTSDAIDVSGYTGVTVTLRLASFSATSGNGADLADLATLAISTNGTTFYDQVQVKGGATSTSNNQWSFASGTGTLAQAYSTTATTSTAAGTTAATRYSTLSVTGITPTTTMKFRVTLLNDNSSETWAIDDIVVSGTALPSASITTTTISPTTACAGSNVTVSYTTSGTFNGTYSAELSDAAGSFTATGYPVALTTVSSTTSSITATIPTTVPGGTGYKIRVRNTDPSTAGSASTTTLTINNVTIAPTSSQSIYVAGTGSTLTATETGATARQWYYGTVSGTYGTAITGATATTYVPAAADFGNTPGTYYVVAKSATACGTLTSNAVQVTVLAPVAPTVTTAAISLPTATGATVGGEVTAEGGATVTVRGVVYSATNTTPTVGGTDVTALPIGSGTGTFSQALSLPAGTYSVRAYATNSVNTAYGAVVTLVINQAPVISSISPTSVVAGSGATTLTILSTGNTFVSGSTVLYNGSLHSATVVNAGQITVLLTSTEVATPGTFTVAVVNPTPGGGTSSNASFTVSNPAPTISSLSPSNATAGGAAFTLTVTGTGFVSSTVTTFSFGGTSYAPNAAGFTSTSFTVNVPAAAIATAGNKTVVVTNPAPSGGTATAIFSVNNGPCLTEGFEATTPPPAGWLSTGGVSRTTTANSGTSAITFSTSAGALTTPELAYPQTLTVYVSRSTTSSGQQLEVQVSTTSQTSNFTTVATYTAASLATAYAQRTVNLASYALEPTVWVRFVKSGSTADIRIDDVNVFCATNPSTSVGTITGSPFCLGTAGAAVSVPFTVSYGPFAVGNTFTAYISNDNFNTKYALNTPQAGTTGGTITGLIPDNAAIVTGSNYRIRVEATNPANLGQRNTADLTVTNYRTNEVVANSFVAVGGNTTAALSWTLPANCNSRIVVIGRLSSPVTVKPSGTFTANASFGSGTDLGTVSNPNQYVLYDGPGTGFTATNLANLSTYYFKVFVSSGAGFSDGSATTVVPVVPATLTEVYMPQYISGHAVGSSTHSTRLPYAFRATIGSLQPNTTYKFYNSAIDANATSTDGPTYGGVGSPIYTSTTAAFTRQSTPGLASGGSFVTDASGSYSGWFGLEPTGNERFEDGDLVRMRIIVNLGDGNNTEHYFLTTTSTVQVRQLTTGAAQATGVLGTSFGTPKNLVLTYDNVTGTGRPLAATWIESEGLDATNYATFYTSGVNAAPGNWGVLTPNNNTNGIRRVEQRALTDGSLVGCAATDADGNWPGGANTASPTGSSTLTLTTGDTPFQPATITSFSPASVIAGGTVTITGTNFTTGPRPSVSFNGGTPVLAQGTSATSFTVVVPANATSGPITVTAGCGTTVSTAPSVLMVVPSTYYTKATGDLDVLATYGDQPDGSGTPPPTFALAGLTFNVSGTGRSFSANWTVDLDAKVVLTPGAEMIIPATAVFTGTLDQSANSSLVIRNPANNVTAGLYQGVQAASSTIELAQTTAAYIIPSDIAYTNLKLTNGEKRLNASIYYDVSGTLTLENTLISSTLLNTSASNNDAYAIFRLNGDLVQLANVTYDPTRSIALQLTNTSTIQTLNGNGGTISLHRLYTTGATVKGGSLSGAGSVLMLGNSRNGGLEMLNAGNTLELGAGTTLRFFGGGNIFGTTLGRLKPDPTANLEFVRTVANGFDLGSLNFVTGFNVINNFLLDATTSVNSENILGLSVNLTVNGSATFQAGTLELNGRTLTLNGSVASGTGMLRGSTTSSLTFGGTGALGSLNFVTAAAGRNLATLTMNRPGGATLVLTAPLTINSSLVLTSGIITTDATNLLTLVNAANITDGSADSHINGPLARTINSGARTVLFPVGKAGNYRPLTLNTTAQNNIVTYTAEQIETPPTCSTCALGNALTRVSSKRYFTINRSVSTGTYSGTITMTFGPDDYVNYPADPTLVVAKRSNSAANWASFGHTAETGTATNGAPVAGTITSGTFTSFSDFSLASTSTATFFPGINPLPVELLSFTAKRQEASVALQWATASEKNSAYFEVQRSQDAEEFTTITKVDAAGSSNKKSTYQALDHNSPATQLYYRLREVDNDGTVAYSPVTVVAATSRVFETAIYPNPAREILNFAAAGPASYRISNVLGQVLLEGTATTGTAAVSVTSLASGTYYLELQTATGHTVRKFSKE